MTTTPPVSPSKTAIQNAENMWDRFVKLSKICGIAIAVVLILMGLTLV